jgi:hypothetical protein
MNESIDKITKSINNLTLPSKESIYKKKEKILETFLELSTVE